MSQLFYNGITLDVVKMQSYTREAVYNGPDYLYTKITLHVRGVFNPGLTGYVLPPDVQWAFLQAQPQNNAVFQPPDPAQQPGQPVAVPVAFKPPRKVNPPPALPVPLPVLSAPQAALGVPAVVTDFAVRHALMQPRGQLLYVVGGFFELISPMPGWTVDAANGPHPLYVNVVEIHGPRTFLVDFIIETYVNDCLLFKAGGQQNPVLSHRFETDQDLDEDYFTINHIRGRVVFRSDLLAALNVASVAVPDDWRSQLFRPVSAGMKREKVFVKQHPDGLTLDYEIVDRELAIGWKFANVTRIEAVHGVSVQRGGIADAVGDLVGGLREEEIERPVGRRLQKGVGLDVASLFKGGIKAAVGLMPVAAHQIMVKVWGNKSSNRFNLEAAALVITQARVAALPNLAGVAIWDGGAVGPVGSYKNGRVHNLMGKYVEMDTTLVGPPGSGIAGGVNGSPLYPVGGLMGAGNVNTDFTGNLLIDPSGGSIAPPGDGLSRGTWLEVLTAQALTVPCGGPTKPLASSSTLRAPHTQAPLPY